MDGMSAGSDDSIFLHGPSSNFKNLRLSFASSYPSSIFF